MKDLKKLLKSGRDWLALGLHEFGSDSAAVEQLDGLPVAWRLLKQGVNRIERFSDDGPLVFDVTGEMIDQIVERYEAKGARIPLDSEHFLHRLAQSLEVDETDVAQMLGDKATFGYGALERREDGLWVVDVEYVPLAKKLISEKVLRYFSPVIRGFATGIWRVTSVAFTNTPALNELDAIAASAETAGDMTELKTKLDALAASAKPKKERESMKTLLTLAAALIGIDAISLSADGDAPQDVLDKMKEAKNELDNSRSLRDELRDALGLSADADGAAITAAVNGMKAKAASADDLKTRIDALELTAANAERDKLIEQGLEEGKLTNEMAEGWAKKQDSAALSAYLKHAPQVVKPGKIDRSKLKPDGDDVALSAEQVKIFENMGITDPDAQKEAAKL